MTTNTAGYFSMPGIVNLALEEPFAPPLEQTTLATFKTYGPEFELNFGVKLSEELDEWVTLIHVTNGSFELGGRYPFFLVNGKGANRKFYLRFYESEDRHNHLGHEAEYPSSDLNTLMDFSFTYKNKVFQWFVNGEQNHMINVAKENLNTGFDDMKIWIGDGKNQIPGSIEYLTLSADGSYEEGKLDVSTHF